MQIHEWGDGSAQSFHRVMGDWSPLKIVLKTRDDSWFLRSWYAHHANLVGPDNIIILDNSSVDPSVLAFYDEISETTSIIRNDNPVDFVHYTQNCLPFYEGLKRTCNFFCILDTDELLMMMSAADRMAPVAEIAKAIPQYFDSGEHFVPTLWLGNSFKSNRYFKMKDENDLLNGLRWGKPIVSTASIPNGALNHNSQIGQLTPLVSNRSRFVVLHLKNLHPDQRIATNFNKLHRFGFIGADTSIEDAILCDTTKIKKGSPDYWISEIKGFVASRDAPEQRAQILIEDGALSFGTEIARSLLASFYQDACGFYDRAGITYSPQGTYQ